ncbi:hypothetical protein BS329_08960 [Amycolatopsis coloradensis]|uniref:HTH araC/xylS-type domain-containing protein n=1 Tax=Amycolatopsis coloradensis TaxID=76021 RepID=A0A1R0KZ49_9PSEU|nr:AraC family transcriptional regulator [Amycolatopsis coloradensis]OLZ54633.1 hypothetical protein BS329_08960 [Amycolatopsis coloradensis]
MNGERVPLESAGCATDQTAEDRIEAVLRSVRMMRENVGDELSLRDLAQSALLSPFHFHRVFRQMTASTPARYLAAWRMAEAKRMLAYSSVNVTDICMQVGYSSLGTFTSQFTRLVGVPPRRFRALVTAWSDQPFAAVLADLRSVLVEPDPVQLTGTITGGEGVDAFAVVGLFSSGIPQEAPAACAIPEVPGMAVFGGLPDGEYYPLAMCFPPSVTVAEAMVDELDRGYFAASRVPVRISGGVALTHSAFTLRVRPRRQLDPPMVLALPLVVAAQLRETPMPRQRSPRS